MGHQLKDLAETWQEEGLAQQQKGDPRLYRAHLMMEELGEMILSMGAGEEATAFDGAIDLLYVLIGTAHTTFGWPIERGWKEVSRSNMTKQIRSGSGDRMRDKGPDYIAPDMQGVLNEHRA